MLGNGPGPASVTPFAAVASATGPQRQFDPPAAVRVDRPRAGRELRAGAAPRLGRADLIACRDVLRRLGAAFGADGRPDRAGPLLGAAEVLRELLERPEAPARTGRIPHPEGPRRGPVGQAVGRPAAGGGGPTEAEEAGLARLCPPLSPRERDVLALLVKGYSNAAIAGDLQIGQRTAESHVANILGKLGVPSRTAAIAYAIRHGLTEVPGQLAAPATAISVLAKPAA